MEKRTEPFTGADCCRTMYQPVPNGGFDNEGLVAILKLEMLKPEYQKPEYQLFRLSSGFGCRPSAGGNACFGKYCIDGLFAELFLRGVEVRIVDNLHAIADEVERSTLAWSCCRMRNAVDGEVW